VAGQLFQRVERLVGAHDVDELDLVELVLADHATHVLAVRPRLRSETRRVGDVATRHLRVVRVIGDKRAREAALQHKADINVIGVDNLRWLVEHYKQAWPFDMVVLDESTLFKSPSAKTRFRQLKRVRKLIDRVVLLTGTPAPNSYLGLWSQIWLLDAGRRLGRTYTGFKQRWFDSDFNEYNWWLKEGAKEEIDARLQDICLAMRKEDYLDLPETIVNNVYVELPPEAKQIYTQLQEQLYVKLEEHDVEIPNAAVLSMKCLQVANGAMYVGEGDERVYRQLHDAKLDALAEIVENSSTPVLVAYQYQFDEELIRGRFPEARKLTDRNIDAWNRGEIPILLAHPASAGHGLNLQDGGNTIAWFGLTWNLEHYLQMNERVGAVRQMQSGYDRPAIIHHIMAQHTIDEIVLYALREKKRAQDALMDALRGAPAVRDAS